jgi:acyl dehydratase
MSDKTDTFLPIRFGTYEEARAWIGRKTEVRACDDEVNSQAIKYFCALVQDTNPNYWNPDEAQRRYGAIISPPGMLMVWLMPLPWRPEGKVEDAVIATMVPLPGDTLINVSTDSEYFIPMKVGDRLTVQEEVVDITPEKNTGLGQGHFITTLATVRNQNAEVVATNRNVMFRFSAAEGAGAKPRRPQ